MKNRFKLDIAATLVSIIAITMLVSQLYFTIPQLDGLLLNNIKALASGEYKGYNN